MRAHPASAEGHLSIVKPEIRSFIESPTLAAGLFGSYGLDFPAQQTYNALRTEQHLGKGSSWMGLPGMMQQQAGLINEGFSESSVKTLESFAAEHGYQTGPLFIGCVSADTATGNNDKKFPRPAMGGDQEDWFTVGFSGSIKGPDVSSTERPDYQVAQRIQNFWKMHPEARLHEVVRSVALDLEGDFSMLVMGRQEMLGLVGRNSKSFLNLGRVSNGGWVLASEVPALSIVGAIPIYTEPGTMVRLSKDGMQQLIVDDGEVSSPRNDVEWITHIARLDSEYKGRSIYGMRKELGMLAAREARIEFDMVAGVPEGGIPAAEGFAEASGKPRVTNLVRNRYPIPPDMRKILAEVVSNNPVTFDLNLNQEDGTFAGKNVAFVDNRFHHDTVAAIGQFAQRAHLAAAHVFIAHPPEGVEPSPAEYGVASIQHLSWEALAHVLRLKR